MISEAIFEQIEDSENNYSILKGIIGYRRNDDAIPISEGYTTVGNVRKQIITTKGWDLCVEWNNGTTSWMPMHTLNFEFTSN